jgi:hypothetical protein
VKKSIKAKIYKYMTSSALGLLVVWYYVHSRWTPELTIAEQLCILCDAFTLPGVFYTLSAVLCSIENAGGLDTISYLMSFVPRMLIPGIMGEPKNLLDYVEERKAKRKKGYHFLYVVGFLFLGIALVFLVLFFRAS